ncbi:MAG: PDDEXK nuclease domain-containing protein [Candidatus Omnitrophota bacterium]
MSEKKSEIKKKAPKSKLSAGSLLNDLRSMIADTRQFIATSVNHSLSILYWRIGRRINEDILKSERAEYGVEIVLTISKQLECDYGDGFSVKNVRHMMRFAEAFVDEQIVSTLSRQLSWSHFKEIIYLKKPLQKEFYGEMCRIGQWSVRTLRQKINSMLYERTAWSKKPEELSRLELQTLHENNVLTSDLVFRDPYFLDFLGLKGAFQEKDLETAIMREMEAFLMELGTGFTFVARQKRITVDDDDFYLDLLFFHRNLRRLVAIELKLDKFRPEYKGQMEMYLRWLDKYERQEGENAPIGIILCAGKKQEQIELLELGNCGIHVAEYFTDLPKKELLHNKLQKAISIAKKQLKNQNED